MTLFTVALAVLGVTLLSVSAAAHVAPSVDDNNRYLKLTPLRGGARLAYTVFFGEIPGASERRHLDTNRDGRIDEGEARRFGDRLAQQVAAALELDTGGTPQRVQWAVVDVGLGNTSVVAGSFSVDMIAYLCAPGGRLHLKDAFRIPRPGETEVLVEDSPGVTVQVARVGAADDPRHHYRFLGPGGPLMDDGVKVEWTASPSAPALPNGGSCARVPSGSSGPSARWLWLGLGAAAAASLVLALVLVTRARR